MNRRSFLRRAASGVAVVGALGAGTAGVAGAPADSDPAKDGDLAPADPEEVGVDPDALGEAVAFLDGEFEAKSFPGAALVASRGGRVFLERYWGSRAGRLGPKQPYDGSVLNILFSFSKVLTGTVVVMAHQDGLVDYDAPVSKYIEEFVGGGKEAITVRHLLTHAAGLPSAPFMPVYGEDQWKSAIAALCAMDTEWEPGSRTGYHGISGMLLAAEVVRRVSGGLGWDAICRERLFDPLGADGFTFGTPPEEAPVALVPPPTEFPAPVDPAHVQFLGHPSGGAFGRPADMLRLLNLHLRKGLWRGKTLIRPEAFAEMHRVQYADAIEAALAAGETPRHEYWGLGWLLRGKTEEGWFGFGNVASENTFGHAGIDTVIGLADPQRDVAMVFLTTASPGDAGVTLRLRNGITNRVMAAVT